MKTWTKVIMNLILVLFSSITVSRWRKCVLCLPTMKDKFKVGEKKKTPDKMRKKILQLEVFFSKRAE